MANDFPQIVDKSTLTGVFQSDQFMVVGVEGQKDVAGSAVIALPVKVLTAEDANTYFGPASSLATLCKFLLARGLNYVVAVASASGSGPTLVQRQAAWVALEENPDIRIRLTDSVTQADLVALADSCEWAEPIQHKQFCFLGLGGTSVKATVTAAASAIASKRAVLTAGHVYDVNGNLLSGQYDAAVAAVEVALNPDIMDSMNSKPIGATAGIEKDAATGLPIWRYKANAGTPVNDFQDLLTAGASPYQQDRGGQAAFTHLRTTWVADTTFDALATLLVKDQVFLDIRDLLLDHKALRQPNTPDNRSLAAKIVEEYLKGHADWVDKVNLADGTRGYGVTVVNGIDGKSYTVNYFGQIQRGTNVINVNGTLTIPA